MPQRLILLVVALLCGCSKYGYEIIEPRELAGQIGTDRDFIATTSIAEYRLRASGLRLLVMVVNHGAVELRLDGRRSVAVAPDGQSRPIYDQIVPAGGSARFYLPPPVPLVTGPNYPGLSNFDEFNEPLDRVGPDITSPYYWRWDGEDRIFLSLVFDRGGEFVEDRFSIQRRRLP